MFGVAEGRQHCEFPCGCIRCLELCPVIESFEGQGRSHVAATDEEQYSVSFRQKIQKTRKGTHEAREGPPRITHRQVHEKHRRRYSFLTRAALHAEDGTVDRINQKLAAARTFIAV